MVIQALAGQFTISGTISITALYCTIAGCSPQSTSTLYYTVDQYFNRIRAMTRTSSTAGWVNKVAGGPCFTRSVLNCGATAVWATASVNTQNQYTNQTPSVSGGYWNFKYIATYSQIGTPTGSYENYYFACNMIDAVCKWQ